MHNIPQITYSNYWSTTRGTLNTLVNKGLKMMFVSGLQTSWQTNYNFSHRVGLAKHISESFKRKNDAFKFHAIKNHIILFWVWNLDILSHLTVSQSR